MDNDEKLPTPGGNLDDVTYYGEFYITNDQKPGVFGQQFSAHHFNAVDNEAHLREVRNISDWHIKQVTSLYDEAFGVAAQNTLASPQIVLATQRSNRSVVCAHEWGHTRKLYDEYHLGRATSAIMYWETDREKRVWNDEINESEASELKQNESERPSWP